MALAYTHDPDALQTSGVPGTAGPSTSRRAVIVGLTVSVAETIALGVAAFVTGSAAMKTQTATGIADITGSIFLLVGVVTSVRPPDERHPLGYGRERFFWSFVAAVGSFVGGFGAAVAETLQSATHAEPADNYASGYVVLIVVIGLESVSLAAGTRPLLERAARRRQSVLHLLWRGTDPAITTVVLGSLAGVTGGLIALTGLSLSELTGSSVFDAAASGLIGLVLLAASAFLLRTNRELLTGRGIPTAEISQMRAVVAAQPGVIDVADLFAVVVGPASLLVDGDVVFDDSLDVPAVEAVIAHATALLRERWPATAFVYLTPVASAREDRRASGRRTMTPDQTPETSRGKP